MSDATLTNKIVLRADDRAAKKIKGVAKATDGLTKAMRTGIGAAAAYFSIGKVKQFIGGSIDLFNREEASVNQLTAALGNLDSAGDLAGLQKLADNIQAITTVGDEATMEIMTLGASLGKMSGDTLEAATVAAMGFAKAAGIDVKAAMTQISKAAQGNFSTMTRYGLVLDETMTDQEKFAKVLAFGADSFNLLEAETETHAGQMAQLSNAWGDYKEQIGSTVMEMINAVVPFETLTHVITNWADYTDLAFTEATLTMHVFANDVRYYLVDVLPHHLLWFADNWVDIFIDMNKYVNTVVDNMFLNLTEFFKSIAFLLMGRTHNWEWVGLTEGFKRTMAELPVIAARALSDTEIALATELGDINARISASLAAPDVNLNIAEKIAKATMPGSSSAAVGGGGGGGSKGGGKSMPGESRFLTMRTGSPINKTAANTGEIAYSMKELIGLQKLNNELQRVRAGLKGTLNSGDGLTVSAMM